MTEETLDFVSRSTYTPPPTSLQEKPKTPRKRVKKEEKVDDSPYNIILPTLQGLISSIPINHNQAGSLYVTRNFPSDPPPFSMSIYSEYIPIMMLRFCNPQTVPLNGSLNSQARQLFKNNDKLALHKNNYHLMYLMNLACDYSGSDHRRTRDNFRTHLKTTYKQYFEQYGKAFLKSEGSLPLNYLQYNVTGIEKEQGLSKFTNFTYGQGQLNVRVGERVLIDTYSMFIGNKPLIVATCLPENYLYHRLRFAMGLPLDLTRVIIFIDKALESPDFPHKSLQKYYNDLLLPEILKTACIIAKVPTEFIDSKCFIERFSISGETPMEINAKKDELKKSFLNSLTK